MSAIELPEHIGPASVELYHLDPGLNIRGPVGGPTVRLDRLGARYGARVTMPPMYAEDAREFLPRLIRGKSTGIRIPVPLVGEVQDGAGSPVVNGAEQSGRTLSLRGVAAGYFFRAGSWLSIVDATGQHYLHMVYAAVRAPSNGVVDVELCELLREPFADGATVHVAKPMIEGFIQGNQQDWVLQPGNIVTFQFEIEEAA